MKFFSENITKILGKSLITDGKSGREEMWLYVLICLILTPLIQCKPSLEQKPIWWITISFQLIVLGILLPMSFYNIKKNINEIKHKTLICSLFLLVFSIDFFHENYSIIASTIDSILLIYGNSIMVRRLHDMNKSGLYQFWGLTIIGIFYIAYIALVEKGIETNGAYEYDFSYLKEKDTQSFGVQSN